MAKNNIVTEFPCDLCGSREAIEVPFARKYTKNQPVHICKKCGFIYVKLRRSSTAIARTWSKSLFGKNYTARIPAVKARQVYVAEFMNAFIGLNDKDVCDIGAGEGQFLEIIRQPEYAARVFGIEPSGDNCRKLTKTTIKHFCGTIEDYFRKMDSSSYRADVTTIMWTLENCRLCKDMLTGAYKILKDEGFVVIATGSRILVPFKKPLYLYFSHNPADTHAFRFSANTLRGMLAVCGFKPVFINNYLDSDILCVIAKKMPKDRHLRWEGDNCREVCDFFRRWHEETLHYGRADGPAVG